MTSLYLSCTWSKWQSTLSVEEKAEKGKKENAVFIVTAFIVNVYGIFLKAAAGAAIASVYMSHLKKGVDKT